MARGKIRVVFKVGTVRHWRHVDEVPQVGDMLKVNHKPFKIRKVCEIPTLFVGKLYKAKVVKL